jgi:hypothetical protein
MDRRANEVHQEALREGDGYILVWPDEEGRATIYPQRADRIVYKYSDDLPGQVEWAAKGWRDASSHYNLTMYYEDRLEKFVSKDSVRAVPDSEKAMVRREVEGEPWPMPNETGRIPLFHFASNAPVGGYGKSELADVVPVQDGLNKAVADMLVAMEYVALPQRYATGLEVEYDEETGKAKEPFKPGVERLWTSPATDTRFGQFDGASLEQFTKVQDSFRAETARVSGTPFHYLMLQGGDWPSGEAMKTAEARFLSRVNGRMTTYGNAWEDGMKFAVSLESATPMSDEEEFNAGWKDPAPRSEKEHAETVAIKKDLGLPQRQALLELGYTEDEVNQFMEEKAAENDRAASQFLKSFDRGGGPPPEIGGVPSAVPTVNGREPQ